MPELWQTDRLGKYCYIKARIGWRGLSASEYTESGPFLIAGKHIDGGIIDWDSCDHISEFRFRESSEIALAEGDVILTKDGTIGRVARVDSLPGKATINGTMMLVRPERCIDYRFLYHVLNGAEFKKLIQDKVSGSSIPHIFQRDMVTLPISFPPIEQQEKLAQVLDTLDTAIQHARAIIAKLKVVKRGLLHDLLTRGIGVNGELRPPQSEAPHLYKPSRLGWIPKEWGAEMLSNCSLKIADRDHTTPKYVEEGVLLISPTNLFGEEGIDFAGAKRISLKAHETNRKKTDLAPGDIILHRIGAGLGRVRLVRCGMPEFSILHSMAQIRPDLREMTSEFMLWAMRAESTKSQMGLGTQSIGVPDLGLDKISNFIIPKPLLPEQKSIASRLDALQARIDVDTRDLGKLVTLKSGLMDDLLTGRVRVTPLLDRVEP